MKTITNTSNIFTRFDINLEVEKQKVRKVSTDELLQKVANCVAEGDDNEIENIVKKVLETKSPIEVIEEGLISGMNEVTRLWDEGVYFLPQVILSSDTMIAGIALYQKRWVLELKKTILNHNLCLLLFIYLLIFH